MNLTKQDSLSKRRGTFSLLTYRYIHREKNPSGWLKSISRWDIIHRSIEM